MSIVLERPVFTGSLRSAVDDSAAYSRPLILSDQSRDETQAEWVVAAAIIAAAAIIVGVAVAWAAYVCSVCQARSLSACVNDLRKWWGAGC